MNPLRSIASRPRLAALATTVVAGMAVAVPAPAQASTSCTSSSLSQAASTGSCFTPFASSSAFSTPLGSTPQLASDNASVQQHMASYNWTVGASANGFSIGAGDGTRPVFYGSPSDPTMTIHCTDEEGPGTCQGANGVDINGAQINVPKGAAPEDNWDGHMTIIETATGAEYDLWHATISGSTITSGTGAVTNVNTGNGTGSGGDAANLALSAGLITPQQLESGQIDHALVMVVPCTNATSASAYSWPATGGWGEYCGQYWSEQASNAPELGQLMKLNMTPAQIAASGAPQWQQTIMTTLANYGAYIEDTEGSWHNEGMYLLTQSSSSWTDLGQADQWATAAHAFGQSGDNLSSNVGIPASRMEMVNTCVTQGTCPASTSPTTTANPVATAGSSHSPVTSGHPRSRRRSHTRRAEARRARTRFAHTMHKRSRRHQRAHRRHHRAHRHHA